MAFIRCGAGSGGNLQIISKYQSAWLGLYVPSGNAYRYNNLSYTVERDGFLNARICGNIVGGNTRNANYTARISINGIEKKYFFGTATPSATVVNNLYIEKVPVKAGDVLSIENNVMTFASGVSNGASTVGYELYYT